MDLNQVTLPAEDLAESARFYRRLGFLQIVDSPHYARFECPSGDATLSLHLVSGPLPPESTIVVYFECADVDAEVARLKRRGIAFEGEPSDRRWRWREIRFKDPAGNRLCLYHAGENRKHPPWRVERQD